MNLTIEMMCKENLKDIFAFEMENRAYFERVLPPRPRGYFSFDSFSELMEDILLEQLNGECYMCLVRDRSGKMVGRVNFSSIRVGKELRASLGYRISESEQGKGYATEAVRLMLDEGIRKLGLNVIEAGTATTNVGSQKVLLKNGFTQVGEEKKVMQVNGQWLDGLLFEKKL